jgi:peptidoglycan/LPS O-acetylase OafA/YrhL
MRAAPISGLPSANKLPGLDLLRAVAIIWVMCFHTFLIGGLNEHFTWLSRYGWMGVDLFFVLSGFLIGSQVLSPLARGEQFSFRDFYVRRAFRILPAFWVVLALYLSFPWFREAPDLESWWKFATFTLNLLIDYDQNQAFSHAWSLCIEEHFYLLFPLLAWLLARRVSTVSFAILILICVSTGIALRAGVWLHDDAMAPNRNWFVEDIYYPTWNRLDGLLAGVTLAALKSFRRGVWDRLATHADSMLAAGLALVAWSFWLFADRAGLLGNSVGWPVLSLGFALLVFAGAQRSGWLGCFALPGAGWLATIAYSLYLVHKPMYHMVWAHFGDALTGHSLLAFTSYAGASLIGATLLYYLVERPGLRLRSRWLLSTSSAESLLIAPTNKASA